ncbi:GNAT family N-acetyltransferase [Liberiplasma polymorphum]|uniref:GNAT family N-acetyltransferase n=1 Tax=Liberiplasma polymorphum TaxID=3374570 RepID=UPI0037761AA6
MIHIRKATLQDLNFLINLERTSFEASRRFKASSIKHSISSIHQIVLILSYDGVDVASAIIKRYDKSLRIYSIAVMDEYRKLSLGRALMHHIIDEAKEEHLSQITLEADAQNMHLIEWYESFGFQLQHEIKDYYGLGEPAYKMVLLLQEKPRISRHISNIVVIDYSIEWLESIDTIRVVKAEDFISDEKYQNAKGLRVFNMCSSYEYQTLGYYVSLLASARNLRVIPNVTTIKDFTDTLIIESIGDEVNDLIQKSLKTIRSTTFTLYVYFGKTDTKKYVKLARAMYKLFEAPLIECTFEKGKTWNLKTVSPLPLAEIEMNETIEQTAKEYFNQKRFTISRFKDYKYDLAILIDPEEVNPPSCNVALSKFKHAADKIGFYTEFITKDDYHRLSEFDALFIRTTTNVNDYTYKFSRYAYAEGLVVIDDPWSILKCSNKLFFFESMKLQGVLTPKSLVVSRTSSYQEIIEKLSFPIVLKQPDSAFSLGVFKVVDEQGLTDRLNQLFETSELIIAQEFIQSAFDWRIGILDNKPLFACKYFMAKNHWQIYNWATSTEKDITGIVETLAVEDVPKAIVDVAIKSAEVMGDGFYGVDIKVVNDKIYVIEVNDNPSVDYRWEDRYLEDELYLRVMKNMYERIETARNIKRRVSQSK